MRDMLLTKWLLHVPVMFGLEAATGDELIELGYSPESIHRENGLVSLRLHTEEEAKDAVAHLNYWLYTAERVLYEIASFPVKTFDELYLGTKKVPWEIWLDAGFEIVVNGHSRKSALFGVPAIQRTLKKAIVERLAAARGIKSGRIREDRRAGRIDVRFSIVQDKLTLMLDTSGEGLHKRGYRPLRHEAPIRETLAAAMLHYSFFLRNVARGEGLFDPLCGSGTFLIEAAMQLSKRAPGVKRHFSAERMAFFGKSRFDRERERTKRQMIEAPAHRLFGSDISRDAIAQAKENAVRAGVDHLVSFQRQDLNDLTLTEVKAKTGLDRVLLITNPPYGERLADPKTAENIVRSLGRLLGASNQGIAQGARASILSPDESFESLFGARADKKRKLYNGMIRCNMYHYFKF